MGRITIDQDKWNQLLRLVADLGTDAEVISDIVVTAPPVPAPEPEPEPLFTGKAKLAWGAKVTPTFRERVWWIADDITAKQKAQFDANWLMACIAWESGETFAPGILNKAGSGATGLISSCPRRQRNLASIGRRH